MLSQPESLKTIEAKEWVPTLCGMCYNFCGILVRRKIFVALFWFANSLTLIRGLSGKIHHSLYYLGEIEI